MADDINKVVILGSGPAGLTAALYTARANLNPLLIEGHEPGGQLTITTEVENYPGFEHGIQGPEMMDVFRRQVTRFGTRFVSGAVTEVRFGTRPFELVADDKVIKADSVIIATGATAKLLGIESEKRLMGYGVSACATCDGAFFKNKDAIVVGGGDTAMEEATFLTRFVNKATVVHRRDTLRASKIMQDRARKNPKIGFIWDSAIEEILGEQKAGVSAVKLKNLKTGKITEHQDRRGLRRDRPQPQQRTVQGPARDGRDRLPQGKARLDLHQHRRRLRLRRRSGQRLSPSRHRRRHRLHGRNRRRTLARSPGPSS